MPLIYGKNRDKAVIQLKKKINEVLNGNNKDLYMFSAKLKAY